jgi:hypothetical protein
MRATDWILPAVEVTRAGRTLQPSAADPVHEICTHLGAQRKHIVFIVAISASAGIITAAGASGRLTIPDGVSP